MQFWKTIVRKLLSSEWKGIKRVWSNRSLLKKNPHDHLGLLNTGRSENNRNWGLYSLDIYLMFILVESKSARRDETKRRATRIWLRPKEGQNKKQDLTQTKRRGEPNKNHMSRRTWPRPNREQNQDQTKSKIKSRIRQTKGRAEPDRNHTKSRTKRRTWRRTNSS